MSFIELNKIVNNLWYENFNNYKAFDQLVFISVVTCMCKCSMTYDQWEPAITTQKMLVEV